MKKKTKIAKLHIFFKECSELSFKNVPFSDGQKWPSLLTFVFIVFLFFSLAQIRLVRGEFVDESGCPVPDWIGLIRAARNSQEQNLEALSDLPGGQVNILSP